jgi:hypothetical protein
MAVRFMSIAEMAKNVLYVAQRYRSTNYKAEIFFGVPLARGSCKAKRVYESDGMRGERIPG